MQLSTKKGPLVEVEGAEAGGEDAVAASFAARSLWNQWAYLEHQKHSETNGTY
jgi:hypothetical protein